MMEKKIVSADVLVVGGGIAGCFAAIAAAKGGAKVIQADKGYVGSSGQSPYAGTFMVFDPAKHDKDLWIETVRLGGDYLANLDWTSLVIDRSLECQMDLQAYGVTFGKYEDGDVRGMTDDTGPGWNATAPDVVQCTRQLRKASLAAGVEIMDRIMVCELLVEDGKICGALGMTVNGAKPVVFQAKSVIIATGGSALKSPGWPVGNLTGDGDMMAYRAGCAVSGKEFIDTHPTTKEEPSYLCMDVFAMMEGPGPAKGAKGPGGPGGPQMKDSYGNPVSFAPNLNLGSEFVFHAGRGPVVRPERKGGGGGFGPKMKQGFQVSCASHGMACHKTEGLWAAGLDGSTNIPGLYGAGDSYSTMMSGAAYASIGLAYTGSAVTGKVSGESAAVYSKATEVGAPSEEKIDAMFEAMFAPMERKGGFTPDWVIQYLQNLTMPYFVFAIKHEDRLKGILEQVRYIKTHLIPKLYVKNDHDLRLAIEVKNMVENVELKCIAGMARKESRGTHYREDYPTRDEENFAGWNTIRCVDGEPTVEFVAMPKEWGYQEGEKRLVDFPTEF